MHLGKLFVLACAALSAQACPNWLLAGGTSAGAVGTGIVATPLGGAVVAVGGTIAEGGIAWMQGWLGVDPPDFVNYMSMADAPFMPALFPNDPTASVEMNMAAQNLVHALSVMVEAGKELLMTQDRLGGAKLVGTAADVANQRMWMQQFTADLSKARGGVSSALRQYASLLETEFPIFYNALATPADIKAMRDQEASGNFLPADQIAMSQWGFTSADRAYASSVFAGLTDAQIDAHGSVTMGQFLVGCAECNAPEPVTVVLVGSALAGLGFLRFRT